MCLIKKLFSIALIAIIISSLISVNVFATENVEFDEDAKGSIVIDYTHNSEPLDDVDFKVYYIATYVNEHEVVTNEKFADFDIEYAKLSSEEYWITTRDNLENYISVNQIECDMEFITDDLGQYKVEDLSLGLYYIEAESVVNDENLFYSEPIMIFVGQFDDDENAWLYHFSIKPKVSVTDFDNAPDITVTKVWENSDDDFVKMQNVEVELYRDGELYDTVVLNEENSWEYTWYDMDPYADWAILETITLQDYNVDYSHDLYEFKIVNTYTGDLPDEPDDPDEEIPQTGSFANQIPIFSGVGLVLILVGFLIKIAGKSRGK